MSYLARALAARIAEALEEMPVVVITGLRQSGKSTLLQHDPALAGREYVSLDDFAQLEAARRNPEAFLRRARPLMVDEAQRCPELLTAIKLEVDRNRRPGRFVLSGSANFALLRGVTESLAGRALYLTLHPLTRRELLRQTDKQQFLRGLFETGRLPKADATPRITTADLVRGGLPPVALRTTRKPALWLKAYEQTYLERDVRDLARVVDLVSFRQLLRLVALRTGQILNVSELSRDAKLNVATASRYLSLLEASFVVSRIPPFLANRTTRLIKSPKLYFADSGLAASLAGASDPDRLSDDPLRGALLETYVAQNLQGLLEAEWPEASLTFWHVQGRHEVDFVVEVGRETLALEVTAASRWRDRDLAGLRVFLDRTPACRAGLLAYGGAEAVRLGDRLWAIPLGQALA
jgi:predicted AAA+ superfamily ATPase